MGKKVHFSQICSGHPREGVRYNDLALPYLADMEGTNKWGG